VNLLAPSFGTRQDPDAAFKLATYSLTPVWLAGAASLFATLHPSLGAFAAFIQIGGAGWGFYILYSGLPIVLGAPEERALAHAAVAGAATAIAAGVAISVIQGVFGALLVGAPG
jgi:hypothetical protein